VHLANTTSQLIDNIPDLSQLQALGKEPLAVTKIRTITSFTRTQMLAQLKVVVPRRAPGSEPGHSNLASMLLGVALEKIYGEPFEVTLEREIENPLHMGSGTRPDTKLLAKGYTEDNQPLPTFGAQVAWPSGTLRYSADSLLRFASWQVVEKDASVKLAHQPTWFTLDKRQAVALYWIAGNSRAGRKLSYSGGTYGFASLCELYPDSKLAVVLLSNKAADGAQASLRALSAKIVEALRPGSLTSPSSWPAASPPPDR
jgi:D-alanyl-D-alanine-carboxypeptidase/D-alanyl-D-alanine-endopeptidase